MKLLKTLPIVLTFTTPALPAFASDQNLPNFAQVAPGLYRGAAPTPAGISRIKAMGVTTVVDLRIAPKTVAKEKALVTSMGMKFVNLPMGSDPPTAKEVTKFLALANGASTSPIYVHCQYGADRTGTMFGIYREIHDHWSYARSYTEMRHYGFKPYYTKLATCVKEHAAS